MICLLGSTYPKVFQTTLGNIIRSKTCPAYPSGRRSSDDARYFYLSFGNCCVDYLLFLLAQRLGLEPPPEPFTTDEQWKEFLFSVRLFTYLSPFLHLGHTIKQQNVMIEYAGFVLMYLEARTNKFYFRARIHFIKYMFFRYRFTF